MEPFPDWADRFYGLFSQPYLPDSEEGRSRTEQGVPRIVRHLPGKGSKVLDLCCGAGTYLFALEKAGYKMTGVDIQQRMVATARKFAQKTKSKARIVKGDAKHLRFGDAAFDAVVFLGAATGHFTMNEMKQIAGEANRVLRPGGVMVAEVNDHVGLFFSGTYRRVLYEPSGGEDVFSFHTRYDGDKGTFNRLFLNLENNQKFKGSFQIWAPWIFDYVMDESGFKLVDKEQGAFGIFSKISVYSKR